jgi:surface antigen
MRFASYVVIGTLGLALGGCVTPGGEPVGTGAAPSPVPGPARPAAAGELGGFVGNPLASALGEEAAQRALETQLTTLDNGRAGSPVDWSAGASRGEVTPGPLYRVNSYECRDYTHQIWVGGRAQSARGTACRQSDGNWRPVN